MKSDIEIAQNADMKPIVKIAKKIGLTEDDIICMANINARYH